MKLSTLLQSKEFALQVVKLIKGFQSFTPVNKVKLEEVFRKETRKDEAKFQKLMQKYFKSQLTAAKRAVKAKTKGKAKAIGLSAVYKPTASPIDIKATNTEFDFSGWSFPNKKAWDKRLQAEGGAFIKEMYDKYGTAAYDGLKLNVGGLEGAFNIDDPQVQKFLDKYTFDFAQGINDTTVDLLRTAMKTGMREGLSAVKMAKKIEKLYSGWDKTRSLLIARTESIRASNGGATEAYIQSGVVTGKEWLVTLDDRLCDWCRPMDGKVVGVSSNFFDKGDRYTIGKGKSKRTMKLDYTGIGYPPLHPACRCTIVPVFIDTAPRKILGLSSIFKT